MSGKRGREGLENYRHLVQLGWDFSWSYHTNYTGLSVRIKRSCNHWHWQLTSPQATTKNPLCGALLDNYNRWKLLHSCFIMSVALLGTGKALSCLHTWPGPCNFEPARVATRVQHQRIMPSLSSKKESLQLPCWRVNRRGDSLHIKNRFECTLHSLNHHIKPHVAWKVQISI